MPAKFALGSWVRANALAIAEALPIAAGGPYKILESWENVASYYPDGVLYSYSLEDAHGNKLGGIGEQYLEQASAPGVAPPPPPPTPPPPPPPPGGTMPTLVDQIRAAYGSRRGDALYRPELDLTDDGAINIQDMSLAVKYGGAVATSTPKWHRLGTRLKTTIPEWYAGKGMPVPRGKVQSYQWDVGASTWVYVLQANSGTTTELEERLVPDNSHVWLIGGGVALLAVGVFLALTHERKGKKG